MATRDDTLSFAGRIGLQRVYEPALPNGGAPVLIDRLSPRGLRREDAAIAHWMRTLPELRELAWHGQITLLFGARDEAHNDACVLRDVLLQSQA